jgi:hypothetical protein
MNHMNPTSELKPVIDNWDKVVRLTHALERYEHMLAGKERVSGDVAFVMSVALENIDPEFDIKEGSAITLRAIKEALVAGAKAAWKIIKQIWQFLSAMYIKFTGSIRRVRRTQEAVTRRLGKLGSKASLQSSMAVAGVQRLSVNGKFVGVDLSALVDIKDLTNYTLNIYPKSVTQIARNCSRKFLNILETAEDKDRKDVANEIVDTFIESYTTSFRAPPGATAMKKGDMTDANPSYHRRSEVVAGNAAFVYMAPEGTEEALKAGKTDPAFVIGSSFMMAFTELTMNIADKSEREIEVPSVKEMTDLTEEISRILTLAEKAETGRRDFETVKTVVDDAIRQIMERTDSGETIPSANLTLQIIGEISKKLAEPMDNFTHWLAITMNVWLTFINHCIDHYEENGV